MLIKLFKIQVKCDEAGLRFKDILLAFTIKTLGGSLFMYSTVCICQTHNYVKICVGNSDERLGNLRTLCTY